MSIRIVCYTFWQGWALGRNGVSGLRPVYQLFSFQSWLMGLLRASLATLGACAKVSPYPLCCSCWLWMS